MEEESRKSFAQITLYNQLINEMDDLYRVYAKNCNLSETGKRGVYPEGDLRLLVLHAPDSEFRTEKYDGGRSAYSAGGGRQPQE